MKVSNSIEAESLVYLVDASIYIFQAHFSPYVDCKNEDGEDLSGLYGFTQFLIQLIRRVKPRFIAIAHDESLFSGFRHQLSADYKSNRELPDKNLGMQLTGCFEVCSPLGLSAFSSRMYEADDIIGTLASTVRSENSNMAVHILSKDKDLAQLLKNKTDCLWDYSANKRRYMDDITTEYGVSPEQFADYLGLVGDPVDCISGVPGVGAVKAKLLLKEFGSLEGVYKNLDRIPKLSMRGSSTLTNTLVENREIAFLSRTLATIQCSVDDNEETFSTVSLNMLNLKEIDRSAFALFLDDYRFCNLEKHKLIEMVSGLSTQVV